MSFTIRLELLLFLDARERSGFTEPVPDHVLAEAVRRPVDEVREELEFLELEGKLVLSRAPSSPWSASIAPKGSAMIAFLQGQTDAPPPGGEPPRRA